MYHNYKQRLFHYHITPLSNLESIKQFGLLPKKHISKFGPMSKELRNKRKVPKIFLLPSLNKHIVNSFVKEWWHWNDPIIVLRIKTTNIINLHNSSCVYTARHESWCFNKIDPSNIMYRFLNNSNSKWLKL